METIISRIPTPFHRRNFRLNTIEGEYPWLTLGAIMEMERGLTSEFKVLELGAGGSTLFFSRRCGSVKSYEPNAFWKDQVKEKLGESSNVTFVHGSVKDLVSALLLEEDESYDLVLVDSNVEKLRMLQIAAYKVKIGGYLVVDNYNTPDMRLFNYRAWKVFTYDQFRYAGKGTRICIRRQ